jgi:hypothetical protein
MTSVLSTPGGSLNPFTVTAADLDQGKEAGDQDGSKEDGCEEEKRYRKDIHGDTPKWSGPLPAKATEVRTDQVYNFGLTDTRIDATRGR